MLRACRRVVSDNGRMAFSAISLAPGLCPAARERAADAGPAFARVEPDYPTLITSAGWTIREHTDVSSAYLETARRGLRAWEREARALSAQLGEREYAAELTDKRKKVRAIEDGLLVRELFVACPAHVSAGKGAA